MTREWGRFTARGGPEIEGEIRGALEEVARTLDGVLSPRQYRCVVLLGGYGRGEGGVEAVKGRERPHNNLDLLVVTRRGTPVKEIRERADRALRPLVDRYGIGIDVGSIRDSRLSRAPCLVMWYDMRFGHKIILGDGTFVQSLHRFQVDRVSPFDVLHLLVNRGTLLVINELLLQRRELSLEERRVVVRHGMKGIIGYGDAALFFSGAYHWSYKEKKRRMGRLDELPASFRELYDVASEFRFRPRYEDYLGLDLARWNAGLRESLEPIHLWCESRRLGMEGLAWTGYLEAAFRHFLFQDLHRPRSLVSKVCNLLLGGPSQWQGGLAARLGCRCVGERGRLSFLFPTVAYNMDHHPLRGFATDALDAADAGEAELRRAYLRAWSVHGDPNFPTLLRRLGIRLHQETAR